MLQLSTASAMQPDRVIHGPSCPKVRLQRSTSDQAAWLLDTAASDDALPEPGLVKVACACWASHPRTAIQLPGKGPGRLEHAIPSGAPLPGYIDHLQVSFVLAM